METNKTALITGASEGIGYEMAKVFAGKGYDLILVARRVDKMKELEEEITKDYPVSVNIIKQDLAEENSAEAVYSKVKELKLKVDVLINNAGIGDYGLFHETSWEKEKKMISLNITTLTQMTKLFLKDMVAAKSGNIINVASTAAFVPGPWMSVYYATKAYVLSISEAIANELKGTGVHVTVLCPGPTKSGFQERAEMTDSKAIKWQSFTPAPKVARYAYKAMKKNKIVAIQGFMNKLQMLSVRFMPRNLTAQMVRKMFEPAKN